MPIKPAHRVRDEDNIDWHRDEAAEEDTVVHYQTTRPLGPLGGSGPLQNKLEGTSPDKHADSNKQTTTLPRQHRVPRRAL